MPPFTHATARLALGLLVLAVCVPAVALASFSDDEPPVGNVFARPFPPAAGDRAVTDGIVPAFEIVTSGRTSMVVAGQQLAALKPQILQPMWPVHGDVGSCSEFGCPRPGHRHNGVDITAPHGTPVFATLTGRVALMAGDGTAGSKGYGNLVCLQHRPGVASCYAHLSRFGAYVRPRQLVRRGDIVGYVGSTGFSTGDHLHFEVRLGPAGCSTCAVDPQRWLRHPIESGKVPTPGQLAIPTPQPPTGDRPVIDAVPLTAQQIAPVPPPVTAPQSPGPDPEPAGDAEPDEPGTDEAPEATPAPPPVDRAPTAPPAKPAPAPRPAPSEPALGTSGEPTGGMSPLDY